MIFLVFISTFSTFEILATLLTDEIDCLLPRPMSIVFVFLDLRIHSFKVTVGISTFYFFVSLLGVNFQLEFSYKTLTAKLTNKVFLSSVVFEMNL